MDFELIRSGGSRHAALAGGGDPHPESWSLTSRTARPFLRVDIAPTDTDRAGLTKQHAHRLRAAPPRLPESANTDAARGSYGMFAYAVSKMLALRTTETVQGFFRSK